MGYTSEVKEYAIESARRVLGNSELPGMIIKAAGSKRGFEMRYKDLDIGVMASNTSHAHMRDKEQTNHPGYYRFLNDAIETVELLGGGGCLYRVRFTIGRFTMNEKAVELFCIGWPYVCGHEQQAEPYAQPSV